MPVFFRFCLFLPTSQILRVVWLPGPRGTLRMDKFNLQTTVKEKNDTHLLREMAIEEIEKDEKEKVATTVHPVAEPTLPPSVSRVISSLLSSPDILGGSIQFNLPDRPHPVHIRISAGVTGKALESGFTSAAASEKGSGGNDYDDDALPKKTQGHYIRNLRHQIFTLYRRLFGVVFIVNMAIFIVICVRETSLPKIGEIAVANLFAAILMRQDYVVNAFFQVFTLVPRSWPLAIRRIAARVYHIGGLHSGFAVSGTVWLVLFTAKATKDVVDGGQASFHLFMELNTSIATLVVTWVIMILLFGIVAFAMPALRSRRHNSFERVHRFAGWTAAAMVWAQVILLINDYKKPRESLSHAVKTTPSFWLVVVFTGSLILPWLRLKKVDVRSVVLSNHAVRLFFDYGVNPIAGSFVRISEDPLLEWHSFAAMPEIGRTGYSVVVSRAGDWTSKQIANPPTKLYIRGIPTYGVLTICPMFRRLVLVATGSGIGPCYPHIRAMKIPIKVLWTAPDVRGTFGDELVDSILEKAPDAVIYDTRKHGKPDMVKLIYRLVREFDAEAVAIISNPALTNKVVYGMMSRGIPAFGAIWDS
ncbi:hypothetical protein V5O48_012915 [Marasmius crinis-equi]|uniref:Nonribosomal peptide synthetase 12 n=1 Tax=Marasmius crinis-equi TaxID=585013 RepID=A0ABR3F1H8_9AGAR